MAITATTFQKVTDRAVSTLAATITDSGLTITVATGDGALFPATGPFIITIESENILIDSRSTDTLTVNASGRGYNSTTAAPHSSGANLRLNIMAKHITDLNTAVNTIENGIYNAASIVKNEVPGGAINGANTDYTTASAFASGSLQVYKNGIRLKGGGEDYTQAAGLSGFTMVTAPASGTVLLCDYFKSVDFADIGTNSLIEDETPTGVINGANVNFTVLKGSYIAGSLAVYLNGQKLTHTEDFTETTPGSGTFAFVSAPLTGAVVRVGYQFNQNASGNADTVDGYHVGTATSNEIPVSPVPINQTALGTFTNWTSWTPTITAPGGTPPTYATKTAYYMQVGKLVIATAWLRNTSGGTAGSGAVSWICSLPVDSIYSDSNAPTIGLGMAFNSGTYFQGLFAAPNTASTLAFKKGDGGTTFQAADQNNIDRYVRILLAYQVA